MIEQRMCLEMTSIYVIAVEFLQSLGILETSKFKMTKSTKILFEINYCIDKRIQRYNLEGHVIILHLGTSSTTITA